MSSGFDPIISMMIEVKNVCLSGANELNLDHSKYREEVLKVLADWKLLSYKVFKGEGGKIKSLGIVIAPDAEVKRRFLGVRFYSRPGRRLYADREKLKKMLSKRKVGVVISTSRDVLGIREAVKKCLGGELLFEL